MFIKPLAILFVSLAITEAIIMLLLAEFSNEHIGLWIPALFDAGVVSLVAIGVITQLLKNKSIVLLDSTRSEFIAFEIGIIVFTLEAVMMLLFDLLPFNLNDWQTGLMDVLALSFFSVVLIYFVVFKPFVGEELSQQSEFTRFEPTIINSVLAYMSFAILLLMALLVTYHQQLEQRRQDLVLQEITELNQTKNEFLAQLSHASRDLLILANEFDIKEFLNNASHAKDELQINYSNIIEFKDYYVQIRVLNTQGKEMIRVQRRGNKVEVSSQQQLQDKSDRYYFKEGIRLKVGEVLISPLDLNVERGVVEQPFNPTIRLATPIVDLVGKKSGVIVINLRGTHLLNKLQSAADISKGKVMLLNSDGYWLFGGDNHTNWAFMFEDKLTLRFQRDYPDVWMQIKHMQHGRIETRLASVILQTIEFSPEPISVEFSANTNMKGSARHWPIWKLITVIPFTVITEQLIQTRKLMIILYFSMLVLAALGTILLARAIITRRKYETEVRKQAFHDHLTGLCNRRLFTEKMKQESIRARRESSGLALMYFDLDYFKQINDELGHDAGDEALKEAAVRLQDNLRDCDIVARLGGDEFAALLPKPGNIKDITKIAERVIESFMQPFELLGHKRSLGISVGIAIQQNSNESNFSLTQRADHAMYEAKNAGRNGFKFSRESALST